MADYGPLFAYTLPDGGHVQVVALPGHRLRLDVKAAGGSPVRASTVLDGQCAAGLLEILAGFLVTAPDVPAFLQIPAQAVYQAGVDAGGSPWLPPAADRG